MFHESHAATADMSVLPSVLGCRTLRRTVQVCLIWSHTLWLPGTRRKRLRCAWHAHLHGLATAIHETSGLERTSPLDFQYCILIWYINSRNQFPSCSDKNPIDLAALRIDCTWDHAYLFAIKLSNLRMLGGVNEPQKGGLVEDAIWFACHLMTF